MKLPPGTANVEHPEFTAEDLRRARPAGEMFPDVFSATRRGRGPQKKPTKTLVSLRIDRETLAAYRATGRGWQARIDEDLAKAAKRRGRQTAPAE